MNNNVLKGLKPYVFRVLVVIMSMSYLLGPLHSELNDVFHSLTHHIEAPQYVISHSKDTHWQHENHLYHKVKHNHGVLDFLNIILKVSNSSDNDENPMLLIKKIDKHIRIKEKLKHLPFNALNISKGKDVFEEHLIQKEFPNSILHPPQFF